MKASSKLYRLRQKSSILWLQMFKTSIHDGNQLKQLWSNYKKPLSNIRQTKRIHILAFLQQFFSNQVAKRFQHVIWNMEKIEIDDLHL